MILINIDNPDVRRSCIQDLAPENMRVVIKALYRLSLSNDPDAKQADLLAGILTSQMQLTGYYIEDEKED